MQCISSFHLGDGQSFLLVLDTSDIREKKINSEHEQLGPVHGKANFSPEIFCFYCF